MNSAHVSTMPAPAPLRDDPVILLGMHHSGTSILAEFLHRFGVFMNPSMGHHESRFFTLEVNDTLVLGGGDAWTRDPILSVEQVMAKLDEVRSVIESRAAAEYHEGKYDGHSPWGFKDPRTCVTLPLYREIFPNARLLHIVRGEADVAESIATNHVKKVAGVARLQDREHWRSLHRQHVARVREYGPRWSVFYEFRYEDFCRHPVDVAREVFKQLELPVTQTAEEWLVNTIRSDRIGIGPSGRGSPLT